jgi:hypothetical protein
MRVSSGLCRLYHGMFLHLNNFDMWEWCKVVLCTNPQVGLLYQNKVWSLVEQ